MKSLGRTIDNILKVAPTLEPQLSQIKSKWKRFPNRTKDYWEELANTVNTIPVDKEIQQKIRNLFLTKRKPLPRYTFDELAPTDKVIGVIPEYLADKIKRQDMASIQLSMLQTKAAMTRDRDLVSRIAKNASRIDLAMKKVWIEIKNHFNLWPMDGKISIKKKDSILYLIEDTVITTIDQNVMIKIDPDTLRGLFRMLGIEPPPGIF